MASALVALAMFASVVSRSTPCCFGLTASDGAGPVGQLSDGQARISQGLPPSTFCINDGALVDGHGRGCIVTPPTTQIQCDEGAESSGGFALGCDGRLSWFSDSNLWKCPTEDHGGYNLYIAPPQGQQGCNQVSLKADGCHSKCPVPVRPPPPVKTCPASLSGDFEFPHLIIPIDQATPDTAHGTSFNGKVTPTVSSLFNFDIPSIASGKSCSLIFLLPQEPELKTSSYTFSGSGDFEFSVLSEPANQATTYHTAPAVNASYALHGVSPGSKVVVVTLDCPAGDAISFAMKSEKGDTSIDWFQDYNADPIGLYITTCHKAV